MSHAGVSVWACIDEDVHISYDVEPGGDRVILHVGRDVELCTEPDALLKIAEKAVEAHGAAKRECDQL